MRLLECKMLGQEVCAFIIIVCTATCVLNFVVKTDLKAVLEMVKHNDY